MDFVPEMESFTELAYHNLLVIIIFKNGMELEMTMVSTNP